MKNIFTSFILVIFSLPGLILAEASNDVKVLVTRCSNGSTVTSGSGIGFIHNQNGYILTSEHAVSIKSDYCYSVLTQSDKSTLKTEVVATDWAHGMALLKLNGPAPKEFVSLADTLDLEGLSENQVITSGFPQQSTQIARDRARVVINGSVRGGFVGQVRLLELYGTLAEFGMSGGATRNARNEKVIGMISHQRVYLTPGKPSIVAAEGEVKNVQSNHFIVISSHSLMKWTLAAISGSTPQYSRISAELVKGMGVLFKQPASADRLILSRAGGNDGVGATGEDDETDRPGITVEVAIASMTELNAAASGLPSFESEWIKSLAADILRRQKLEFTHLLVVNPNTNDVKLRPITSIAQMISAIRTQQGIPIPKVSSVSGQNAELDAIKAALLIKTESPDLQKLLEILKKLVDVKIENPGLVLPPTYFNVLEQHEGWNDFSDGDLFDRSIIAKRFLHSLTVRNGLGR